MKALLRVRDEFRGVVDVQVVAFAQDGIVREPGAGRLLREAMAPGADVVGGIPWIERSPADVAEHIKTCFDLAVELDCDVSMLLDDTGDPALADAGGDGTRRDRPRLARPGAGASLSRDGAVSGRLRPVARRAAAGDPHCGGLGPAHRAAARAGARPLLADGVTVCLGQDDISDAYYPFGRNSMLEVAFLAAHLLWMTKRTDLERLYDMVTVDAARAMNVQDFGLAVGNRADLVVLDAPDVLEALREHAPRRT